jgi:hypothetical protein
MSAIMQEISKFKYTGKMSSHTGSNVNMQELLSICGKFCQYQPVVTTAQSTVIPFSCPPAPIVM